MKTLEARKLNEEITALLETYLSTNNRFWANRAWTLLGEDGVSEQLRGPRAQFNRELAAEWLKDLRS